MPSFIPMSVLLDLNNPFMYSAFCVVGALSAHYSPTVHSLPTSHVGVSHSLYRHLGGL